MNESQAVTAYQLAASDLLGSLPDEMLEELARASKLRRFPAGHVIFKEGDLGESLHIIVKGIVAIRTIGDAGKEVTLVTMAPGQVFGELAVFDPAPRSATAVTVDVSETVEVGRTSLDQLLDGDPSAARRLLGSMARRLTEAKEEVTHDKLDLDEQVKERTAELQETQLEVIRRLGRAAEFRDDDTGLHISRMSQYCVALARAAGMSKEDCNYLLNAAPMHDIGKIGIPDRVLLKPGKLEPDEFDLMKTHTTIGEALLSESKSEVMKRARVIALSHHEKWDGSGYPQGLSGEDIPFNARICTVCDVFDALTSERPYKKAWTFEEAVAEIKRTAGAHFDPHLAELFASIEHEIREIKDRWSKEPVKK